MADFVAGDVVARLRMDSTQFTQAMQAAQQQFARLQQSLTQLRTTQTSSQQALTQQTQALTQMHQASTQAATSVSGLSRAFAVASGIGMATSLGAVVSQLKALASATLASATQMESLRAQFTALQGAGGQQSLASLFRLSQQLGAEFTTVAQAFRSFTAATQGTTIEGAKAEKIFASVVTAARAMGASSEQTGRALLGLQQIISKGTVTMEDLRGQVAEALPGGMGIAARAMGVTTQELNKLVEKGLDATQFVERFAAQLQREFGGKAAGAVDTAASAFQRLRNELGQLGAAVAGSGLLDLLRGLADQATRLLETLRKGREETQRALGGPAPVVPRDASQLSPAIRARHADIEDRRQQLTDLMNQRRSLEQRGATPGLMIEQMQEELRALQTEQRQALEAFQQALVAEGGPGSTGGTSPAETALDEINRLLDEGKQKLREMDVRKALVPPLELATEKATAWRTTMDGIDAVIGRLPEPLLKSMVPGLQATLEPANKLAESLSLDLELARDLDKTVTEMLRERQLRWQDVDIFGLNLPAETEAAQKAHDAALKATRQETVKALDLFGLEGAPEQEQALKEHYTRLRELRQHFAREGDLLGLDLTPDQERLRAFERTAAETVERLSTPRAQRESFRLRRQAERQGIDLTPHLEAQLRLIDEQTRWNTLMTHAERIGDHAAQTITSGLMRMTEGTVAVAEGFRAMAKDILDSMAHIALNETFKTLFGLGLGLLSGAATGGAGGGALTPFASTPAYQTSLPLTPTPFQHGGVVNRPTLALLGEGHQTEYVMNRNQMNQLMSSALRSGAGGSGPAQDVSVILVDNRGQAERVAAQERSLGRNVIIQEVANELAQGSGSRLGQLIKTIQR